MVVCKTALELFWSWSKSIHVEVELRFLWQHNWNCKYNYFENWNWMRSTIKCELATWTSFSPTLNTGYKSTFTFTLYNQQKAHMTQCRRLLTGISSLPSRDSSAVHECIVPARQYEHLSAAETADKTRPSHQQIRAAACQDVYNCNSFSHMIHLSICLTPVCQ